MNDHHPRRRLRTALQRFALGVLIASPLAAAGQNLDLVNVTLVDGTGAAPRKGM